VEFDKLTKKGGVSHRKIGAKIEEKVYKEVEKFTYWHGPVWNISYGGSAGSILKNRMTDPKVWVESTTADLNILSVDAIQYCDDRLFMLA